MHDIDRTMMEYDPEYEYEYEDEPEFEYEYESSNEYEYEPEYEPEYEDEYDLEYEEEYEAELESVFDESEEMELAAELLGVTNEAELDQFLGKIVKKASRIVRKIPFKRIRRSLFKHFRPLVKRALPVAGRAFGTYIGGPFGGQIGGMAASRLGRAFGLELEGLSPEDQEFEVSRRTVRLLGSAIANVAKAPPAANPETVAKAAIMNAVKTNAPGLLTQKLKRPSAPKFKHIPGQKGNWYRSKRGNIVLVGL